MKIKCCSEEYLLVKVTKQEVLDFKNTWPCSGLPDRAITFCFERNGDLVDIEPDYMDGEALTALSYDAQDFMNGEIAKEVASYKAKTN